MSARAAARAYIPPEPIPIRPSSGSITSPFPEIIREASALETASRASRFLSILSVRHSLANSTAELRSFPLYCSSFSSNFSKRVKASAVEPANQAMTFPSKVLRNLRAEGFMMVFCMETCPSPAITTRFFFRTQRIVVIDFLVILKYFSV